MLIFTSGHANFIRDTISILLKKDKYMTISNGVQCVIRNMNEIVNSKRNKKIRNVLKNVKFLPI